jgi:iron(III) transport system ATP-binding protein
MAEVTIRELKKFYGGVQVVHGLDLDIADGEFVVLVGPSGCGKSTLLRMIAGLEEISSGDIRIGDRRVNNLPPSERDIAMVFQNYALYPHKTVGANMGFALKMRGMDKAVIAEKVTRAAGILGLTPYLDRYPRALSGGQRHRVAMGRAIVRDPQVFLFDEPLSNLDAKLRRQVREEIREIQQTLGLTVVYVTHDQEEALAVSDEIVVMRNAAIAQKGTPRELYEAPADAFVADFIGEANLIPVEITALDGDMATVRIADYTHRLPSRGLPQGPAKLAVRPSRMRLVAGQGDGVAAVIDKATYVGSRMEYTVTAAFGTVFAVLDDVATPFKVGDAVTISFAASGPVLIPAQAS